MPKGRLDCLKQFLLFAIFASTLLIVEKYFPLEFLVTYEFGQYSFGKKLFYTMIICYLVKCKFYAGWCLE